VLGNSGEIGPAGSQGTPGLPGPVAEAPAQPQTAAQPHGSGSFTYHLKIRSGNRMVLGASGLPKVFQGIILPQNVVRMYGCNLMHYSGLNRALVVYKYLKG